MALLSIRSISSIQIFLIDAVNFEVFSKRVIPIKVRVWVLCYKGVQLVNWIWGVYWITIGGDIYFCKTWGLNSRCKYIDCIYSNVYRPIAWLRVVMKVIFGFLPWQKYVSVGRVYYGEETDSFDESINALDGHWGCKFTPGSLENPDQINQSHL